MCFASSLPCQLYNILLLSLPVQLQKSSLKIVNTLRKCTAIIYPIC